MQGGLTPIEAALTQLLSVAPPPPAAESVPLGEALGRILARDEHAVLDVPPADNSAMDGYAVRSTDAGGVLPESLRLAAGDGSAVLASGGVARIFTGAEIPAGADAVVMQEDVSREGDLVRLPSTIDAGQHIRRRAQDCRRGECLLRAGRCLQPQDIGLLASQGFAAVHVYRRVRVALLSTGSELRQADSGGALPPGAIYNSNGPMLAALLQALGIEVYNLGIIPDRPDATREALREAGQNADAVISSGGVSVGEADYVRDAVGELGELTLWKVAIKPGKPFALGRIGAKPFLGLPGNPSSAFVTFLLLARPFLLRMQGRTDGQPSARTAIADFEISHPGSRQEYLRVSGSEVDGILRVKAYPNQSSGVLSSLVASSALAVIPPGVTVARGDPVEILVLSDLLR